MGRDWANSWRELLIGQGFHWKDSTVFYAVGQPMGLYSSWPLLAVTHHLIVKYAAESVGKTDFRQYRILGDDIVIRDSAVAGAYRTVMADLGVVISPEKTLVSRDTFEFAKRLFHQGTEITAFPVAA